MELRECPFCGGEAIREQDLDYLWIECAKCGHTTGIYASEEARTSRWNTRVADPLLDRMAEAVKDTMCFATNDHDVNILPDHQLVTNEELLAELNSRKGE